LLGDIAPELVMENRLSIDPDLAPDMIRFLNQELKTYKQRVADLEVCSLRLPDSP
jgi:hypothetical protein